MSLGQERLTVARKEIPQRMNHLKDTCWQCWNLSVTIAQEETCMLLRWVERTRLDILGKNFISMSPRKRNTSEWRLLSDLSLRRVWTSGMTKNHEDVISNDFLLTCHVRSDSCFKFPALEWDSARPRTTSALKLQQATMRVEALSDGVRRSWAAVNSEVVSANQKYQSAGPLARHSVQPDKRVMRGCEGRVHQLDRTQTETSRCGLYNRPPPCTANRTMQPHNDWRFNLEHLIQLRMSLLRPPVQRRALVGVVAIDV